MNVMSVNWGLTQKSDCGMAFYFDLLREQKVGRD